MARSGDTKLLSHVAQMIIALSGGDPMASQRWQIPSFVPGRETPRARGSHIRWRSSWLSLRRQSRSNGSVYSKARRTCLTV